MDARDAAGSYDRDLLLHGPKRNEIVELWEVERYGVDSYRDADYVSLYGLRPAEWYPKGIRLLGRTVVECTRDALGSAIGHDVAGIAAMAPPGAGPLILDLFAGSGNTLYWLLRHIPGAEGFGFEVDARVFELTRRNLAALGLSIRIVNADYRSGLIGLSAANRLLIAFIAPPWGKGLDEARGLDLRRTRLHGEAIRPFVEKYSLLSGSADAEVPAAEVPVVVKQRDLVKMVARTGPLILTTLGESLQGLGADPNFH